MAVNQGATRLYASTRLRDTTTAGGWCASAYVGEHYSRESFDRPTTADPVGSSVTLNGRTVTEGGQVWGEIYDTSGVLVPSMHAFKKATGTVTDDYKVKRRDADGVAANAIVGRASEYFLSAELHWAATPPLGGYLNLGFGLTAPGPSSSSSRLDLAAGTYTNGWTIWAGRNQTNAVIRLYKNGVAVGTPTNIAIPAAGEVHHVEMWKRGSGTASDPTKIKVWHNGAVVIDATDSADPYAAQTYNATAQSGTAGVASSLEIDNIFITSVPSSPGAIHDHSTIWPELPIAPRAAGTEIKVRMRAAKYLTGGQVPSKINAELRTATNTSIVVGAQHDVTTDVARHYNETTFHLTSTGASGGTSRSGGYRIVVQLNGTDTLGAAFVIDSEGRETTLPAGTENRHNPGYSVASTTLQVVTPAAKLVYPDSFTLTARAAARPWAASDFTPSFTTSQTGTAAGGGTPGDTGAGGSWGTTDSVSPTFTMDNSYRQADAGARVALTWAVWAARNNDTPMFFTAVPAGYEQIVNPDRTVTVRSIAEDAFTADPRLTSTEHIQVNDKSFGSPPTAKAADAKRRLTSDLGFLAVRYTNARGEGQNSLTFTEKLWDTDELISSEAAPVKTRTGLVTTTQGGEVGWSPSLLTWDSALPSGSWIYKPTVTAPSSATGLDADPSATVSLVASDPNLRLIVGAGPTDDKRHFTPGSPFITLVGAFNTTTRKRVAMDAGSAKVALLRVNLATEKVQYLASDGVTWVDVTDDDSAHFHDMSALAGDAKVFKKVFVSTAGWTSADVVAIGKGTVGGVPISGFDKEISVQSINNHDAYKFDGPGFLGFPTR